MKLVSNICWNKVTLSYQVQRTQHPQSVGSTWYPWTPYPATVEYTFLLGVQETFMNTLTDQILHHKKKNDKCERIEFIQSTVSENSAIKLEISNRKIAGKSSNKNIILYNPWSQRWSLEENWNILFLSGWKYKYNRWKCMEWSLTGFQRKFVALNTCIGKEVKLLSRVWLFATPWTVTYQAPPSIGFSRQEYWSGLPFPSPGDLPDPGIEPGSPAL